MIRKALATPQGRALLPLYRVAMGCIGYFACEKRGFDAFYRKLDDGESARERSRSPENVSGNTPGSTPGSTASKKGFFLGGSPQTQQQQRPNETALESDDPASDSSAGRRRDVSTEKGPSRSSLMSLIHVALDMHQKDRLLAESVS